MIPVLGMVASAARLWRLVAVLIGLVVAAGWCAPEARAAAGAGTKASHAWSELPLPPRCATLPADWWQQLVCLSRREAWPSALAEAAVSPAVGALGGPRSDLNVLQMIDFFDGRAAFQQGFSAAQGLGPHFNASSCAGCHSVPTVGGRGRDIGQDGIAIHAPAETEGNAMGLRKHTVSGYSAEVAEGPRGQLRSPPLYGVGLLDRVSDEEQARHADPEDRDGDGIRGTINRRGTGQKACRFGQKANDIHLLSFVAGAFRDEMGLTSPLNRNQAPDRDTVADPEVDAVMVRRVDAFVRGLAPPPRAAVTAQAQAGERQFATLGCPSCHMPQLGEVQGAYTDLLLHDMGEILDNQLRDGLATGKQWRTAPLWGFRFRSRYLHDERAADLDAVQAAHGGEAAAASARYRALPAAAKAELLAFLQSL